MMLFHLLFPLLDWLYILQTLEYDGGKFLEWFAHHGWKRNLQKKKRLVFTAKAALLFWASFFLLIGTVTIILVLGRCQRVSPMILFPSLFLLFLLVNQLSFLYLLTAAALFAPFDWAAKTLYLAKAKKKLVKLKNLTVIGITGSFGKTSTKEILKQMLQSTCMVLATPESFNTSLGIAKIILRDLTPQHNIFIVEMGAYHGGEIQTICNLVKPTIGILTGINEQHLEKFGSLENTLAAKRELLDSLPANGLAILNFDNAMVREVAKTVNVKTIGYSIDAESMMKATAVSTTSSGSTFSISREKETVAFATPLLGKHNVSNILAALAAASSFNIPLSNFKSVITHLSPPPHRLQIVPNASDLTIIDDAFSGNPSGFEAALQVLNDFNKGRKILITPGIVELGNAEKEIHMRLGKLAATICDIIILVGKNPRTDALAEGIHAAGFAKETVFIVKNLAEAQKKLPEITQASDVILFENDLPDQY